jgi:hypothetical protein
MPLTLDSRKKTLDPDRLVVCWGSFAGPAGDVQTGSQLRASDPRVAQAPTNFVELDVPREEWPSVLDLSHETERLREQAIADERRAAFETAAKTNRIKLSVQLFKSTRDVYARVGGLPATVEKGSIVLAGDALLEEFPDDFEPS